MKRRTIAFYITFGSVGIVTSILLSILFANLIYYIYSPNPEEIVKITPSLMFSNLLEIKAVNNMFWIILGVFGILLFLTRFNLK